MAVEPEGGVVQSEAGQGEGAQAPAVVTTEAGAGAGAQDEANAAREAMLAEARENGRQAAREEWARLQTTQPAVPAGQPPTAARGEYAELQAEGLAIQGERERLVQAFARDGYTAENIVAQNNLTSREGRWLAQVNLAGMQRLERDTAVSARSDKEDAAKGKAWKSFAAEHASVDPDLLKDAFDKRWEREHAPAVKPAGSAAQPPGRSAVNVSGPSEVTAAQVRARTMTREAANQHRATLRSEGRDGDAAKFDRDIRNGGVILKG